MLRFTAQFFAAVLASSLQILAADTLFPYLIPSVDPNVEKENLDCICQAFDAKSAFQEGANPDKCAEDFNIFLSANLAMILNNITLETCKDRKQQLPQDYCGYPNELAPFSVDKTSSKLCSSTADKEICAYQTFQQPDTPCFWSSGRQCYWNLTTATCQGTLSKWFIQAYGLSSDTETICSKQITKSKCRSTYMLKGHCTSSCLDGEDRDKVCASQTESFACSETTFSAVRACKWQAKVSGMEATYASCCTSSPYQRPLAGIIWCGFTGLSYVSDGRISSSIGTLTCDDVAGTFIRYQQSREIVLDVYGPPFILKIDNACCTPPESLPDNSTVYAPQKPNLIFMHPTAVSKPTSYVPIQRPIFKSRTPTRHLTGTPAAFHPNSTQIPTALQPNSMIAPQSPSIQKSTSYVPIKDAIFKSREPTRHPTGTPAAFIPMSIFSPQFPSNQPSIKGSRVNDPAINTIPIYGVLNSTTGKPTVRLNSTDNATKAPFSFVQSPKSFNLSPTNGQLSDALPSATIQKPISATQAPTQAPSLHAQKYTSIPAPFLITNGTVALKGSGKLKIGAAATALLALPLLGFFGYKRRRWARQATGAKMEAIDVNPDDL